MEPRQLRNLVLIALAVILVAGSRTIADFIIEYSWWREVGQVSTWVNMLLYQIAPAVMAALIGWTAALWAHARGMYFSGVSRRAYPLYTRIVSAGLLLVSVIFVGTSINSWKVMAYVGSQEAGPVQAAWLDPVFGRDLSFYLFDLPFYTALLGFVFTVAFISVIVFWATARGWQIYERFQRFRASGRPSEEFDPGPNPLLLEGATQTSFARILASIVLVGAAGWFFLGRYSLLLNTHPFMTGMDFVDEKVTLPLRWAVILALLAAVPLVWMRRLRVAAGVVAAAIVANSLVPTLVRAAYVRPNELQLEKDYIARHIEATRVAYDLSGGSEVTFAASLQEGLDVEAHATLVDNIRLWDTAAFTDTITQIQALRPYYRFADIDIDRYTIDGKLKQVLLSPREIDINQLPAEARASWINTHFFYTHGFGVVMSEVNRTTPDGLPVLLIQDAPPEIRSKDLDIKQAAIYYGEVTHDPVFVDTDQAEFDYPSGDRNITSSYQGKGGFPIDSLPLRVAAALREGEINIILTGLTNANSRMMIYRNVSERLEHLADFIEWDYDPYLAIAEDGRLVWIVDGYTVSDAHPYSAPINVPGFETRRTNYIRNSVKATIDAYDGSTTLYLWDESDPIIQAYAALFPQLFTPKSEMPPSVRAHTRYPLMLFDVQAELYRTFHMKDPEVFYNKEDVWEVAQSLSGDTGRADRMKPTYIVARLPGVAEPEFILMLPFTPRGKDNLIGWMAARCDGDKLGELLFFQLSKQQLVFGPNQIESRINQDQEIAKDLTLWNQQGSRVLRGELLALPVDDAFLYVESIYIQAESARMPQLRKVVLAMGNRLIYEDTFGEALDKLSIEGARFPGPAETETSQTGGPPEGGGGPEPPGDAERQRSKALAQRLRDLRRQAEQLASELEKMERELQ
ncbi:MAG: UPF0182 family protein [Acidobacteria bacterium]|nr:UPF0182 family protein [Acidobacteriota bacterium]